VLKIIQVFRGSLGYEKFGDFLLASKSPIQMGDVVPHTFLVLRIGKEKSTFGIKYHGRGKQNLNTTFHKTELVWIGWYYLGSSTRSRMIRDADEKLACLGKIPTQYD
jgi:hypothetical protein